MKTILSRSTSSRHTRGTAARRNPLSLILLAAALSSCSGDIVKSNLSFFATATSDSYKREGYMAFMATDGEADSYGWESELKGTWNPEEGLIRNPEGLDTWLQLEFPNPTKASEANIYWDPKASENNIYCLEYSKDGQKWAEVPRANYSREKTTVGSVSMLRDAVRFRPIKASKFRIRIEAGNDSTGFGRVREFELLGDLRQFDSIETVKRTLNGEIATKEPLKIVNNPSDPWHLDLPKPEAGVIADGIYLSGPGLENDADGNTDFCSQMQIISGCSADDFENYASALDAAGYKTVQKRSVDNNIYAQFQGNGITVYAYYTDSENYIRVICENSPVTQENFSFQATSAGKVGIYQFALNYAGNTHDTMDCGMLYALLPGDGSVMLMDGSHMFQTSEEFYRGVYDFLREITGTPEGEKIRISNWYITHEHSDHLAGASGFLRRYHDNVDLQRVMFNFPSFTVRQGSTSYASQFRRTLRTYFPDVTYMRPHTGMHLNIGALGIDVMYTHEDAIQAENPTKYTLRDFNCTSTILKVTMGGRTIILFGDSNVETENIVVRNYTPETWKADLVQVAHHCFNYLHTLYGWCQAPLLMVPQSYENAHTEENTPKMVEPFKYATKGIYYEGDATYGFAPTEDGFELCYEKPRVGHVMYDGTGN